MKFSRELMKGSTATLILSLVNERPMYGYQIVKEINERTHGMFEFKEGTLYPMLHKLEGQGLLRGKWQTPPGGRERKYYQITKQGAKVLSARIKEWRDFAASVNLVLEPQNA